MNAVVVRVADAVVDSLIGAPIDQAVVAQRSWLPRVELAALDTLHLTVTPITVTIEPAARDSYDHVCRIEVGIQKKVDPESLEALDAMAELTEAIINHLKAALPAMPEAELTEIGNAPIVSRVDLNEKHVFTSVIAVTYRVRQ